MSDTPIPAVSSAIALRRKAEAVRPFLGLLDPVLVPGPVNFEFDGAISHDNAAAAWSWFGRDIAPDLVDLSAAESDASRTALAAHFPELVRRGRAALAEAQLTREAERHCKIQLGGEEPFARLPMLLDAMKCRPLLDKAQAFGRAANAMHDEPALALALQAMPLNNRTVSAVLLQAALGQVSNPARLVAAAIRIAGGASEKALHDAGLDPLLDAILAHAQAQIPALQQMGPFADIDLSCRAIDRFHRLMRAITGFVELGRLSRWAMVCGALTRTVSELLEPKLRDVVPDLNRALRRPREGIDRLDRDLLLSALNGVYLLATVRDCRDSLALNTLFEQIWTQVGQALELHVQRNLDLYRQSPSDQNTAARLDAAIKMAELRFNSEYADVLRRAQDSAGRRAG